MAAVDPTYPLYSIACLLASLMLLLVLLTSFVRQSWNLGVAFLCFWLFLETLTAGIDAIIWSDNADVKLFVYCDIVTHIQVIAGVVKPMATLIITRRLSLITRRQSVEPFDKRARYKDLAIEWTLGLVIPVLVAGPLYYVVQWPRFQVVEGFGCDNSPDGSVLSILLLKLFNVIPPLVSIAIYYPNVARTFYRHSQDINRYLSSSSSISRAYYFRVLALASIDIMLTLPIGIVTLVLTARGALLSGPLPFYFGWTLDHTDWTPESLPYAYLQAEGTLSLAASYFIQWTSPVLAFAIFALFGVTPEARGSYRRIMYAIGRFFGWKAAPRVHRARSSLGEIEFGERPTQHSTSLGLGSHLSANDASTRVPSPGSRGESTVGQGGPEGVPSEKDVVNAPETV
ncbi:unnamed protein product [Peniophora sp. CBMAI 1063]|nr:unnamed protein product [Peniophora sp. CBMAI 1063]